jgi:hypothetical protein
MNILIIGATSAIAQEVAKQYATQGHQLFLVGRSENKLEIIESDLKARGATTVYRHALDLRHINEHDALLNEAKNKMGSLDVVLIAHGSLPNQLECQASYEKSFDELQTNCLSVISLLTRLANILEQQQRGTLAVITSVAGDRGRQSNYLYGTAKGALNIFLQGLRNRFGKTDIKVITIKPGFVDTPMTRDFDKGALWAQPKAIAEGIINAIEKGRHEVYLPFFWRYIMMIIKSIPEGVFKKMSL